MNNKLVTVTSGEIIDGEPVKNKGAGVFIRKSAYLVLIQERNGNKKRAEIWSSAPWNQSHSGNSNDIRTVIYERSVTVNVTESSNGFALASDEIRQALAHLGKFDSFYAWALQSIAGRYCYDCHNAKYEDEYGNCAEHSKITL